MKTTITKHDFHDAFNTWGGGNRKDSFSYEGLDALFDYLEELEDSTGEEQELDVVAIDSEFTEYESFEEVQKDYDVEDQEELEMNTIVLPLSTGGLIIQNY